MVSTVVIAGMVSWAWATWAVAVPVLPSDPTTASTVVLQPDGASWRVDVDPQTTAVTIVNGATPHWAIQVAAPQSDLGAVAELVRDGAAVQWHYPAHKVRMRVAASAEGVRVQIDAHGPGAFCWPAVDLSGGAKALIWPSSVGRYIPVDDAEWWAFMLSYGPWDTLAELNMPFWGVDWGTHQVTYIATNPCNNAITFVERDGLYMRFTHTFPRSRSTWRYGFEICVDETASPIAPARRFRQWLDDAGQLVSLAEKARMIPRVDRLRGAIHAYVWGDGYFTRHDIARTAWRPFCQMLVAQAGDDRPSVGKRLHARMSAEAWQGIVQITNEEWPSRYLRDLVAAEVSRLLEAADFYDAPSWHDVNLPDALKAAADVGFAKTTLPRRLQCNGALLQAAFPQWISPVDRWGDGISMNMLDALADAGLERVRLCVDGRGGVERRPEVAARADELGYLFGIYDSFHSIHNPQLAGTDATWDTAQFNQELFDTGAIVDASGRKLHGFKKRGYKLSPLVSRPAVEARVRRNFARAPYSYYFVDCDAFGEVFDDYAPQHRATQAEDAAARADRLRWIGETFGAVVGSEGGSVYATPGMHVAEGVLTPVIGWGDPDMHTKGGAFYVGGYWPPNEPEVYFANVTLKPEYVRQYYDPRFRLPLYEVVFHDAVVATHHWSSASLKFTNVAEVSALFELLYLAPPLYHLNRETFGRQRAAIKRHYDVFSPLHASMGFAALTDFAYLTPDRMVQQTVFGNRLEITVNFDEQSRTTSRGVIPPRTAVARWRDSGRELSYQARSAS